MVHMVALLLKSFWKLQITDWFADMYNISDYTVWQTDTNPMEAVNDVDNIKEYNDSFLLR